MGVWRKEKKKNQVYKTRRQGFRGMMVIKSHIQFTRGKREADAGIKNQRATIEATNTDDPLAHSVMRVTMNQLLPLSCLLLGLICTYFNGGECFVFFTFGRIAKANNRSTIFSILLIRISHYNVLICVLITFHTTHFIVEAIQLFVRFSIAICIEKETFFFL